MKGGGCGIARLKVETNFERVIACNGLHMTVGAAVKRRFKMDKEKSKLNSEERTGEEADQG